MSGDHATSGNLHTYLIIPQWFLLKMIIAPLTLLPYLLIEQYKGFHVIPDMTLSYSEMTSLFK